MVERINYEGVKEGEGRRDREGGRGLEGGTECEKEGNESTRVSLFPTRFIFP